MSSRLKHNPLELIKKWWPNADVSHIEYDPSMSKGDYSIIRQSSHDGTLLFTLQTMQEALLPIVNRQSYFKTEPPENWSDVVNIKYKIGPMRHAVVFGDFATSDECGRVHEHPGQRERVRIPVICEIISR